MAERPAIDALPGYRRRFVVTPAPGRVVAELEDDYHHMTVAIHHEGGVAVAVEGHMHRQPWSTCPGAEWRLRDTFTGVALADFEARGQKQTNCTHLHDLAILAAAHAGDGRPCVYDVLRADPDGAGLSRAVLRLDGRTLFDWTLRGMTVVAPDDVAGLDLFRLKPLLERLDAAGQEAARVLRWGVLVGSGRQIPIENQSDATRIPPNCYNFQPERARFARRIGTIRDFTAEGTIPLDDRAGAITPSITENETA